MQGRLDLKFIINIQGIAINNLHIHLQRTDSKTLRTGSYHKPKTLEIEVVMDRLEEVFLPL